MNNIVKATLLMLFLASFLTCTQQAQTDELNYCHDPDAKVEWDRLLVKYPDDMKIQALHSEG